MKSINVNRLFVILMGIIVVIVVYVVGIVLLTSVLMSTEAGLLERFFPIFFQSEISEKKVSMNFAEESVPAEKTTKGSISQEEFIKLFEEICPELLAERGTPISELYVVVLEQFASWAIDKEFVSELLRQMKSRSAVFDGKGFYGFEYVGVSDPERPMDINELKKDTISVAFYLRNVDWYSKDIFRKLTKQGKVKFALEISGGGFLFEALKTMTAEEFLSICSDGNTKYSGRGFVYRGDIFWIPEENLRRISRIGEFKRTWKDHLGVQRHVNVVLDLGKYQNINGKIHQLPDGTIVKDDNGELLSIDEDKLFIQRIYGRYEKTHSGWKYIEDGEAVFEIREGKIVKTKWGVPDEIENAQIFEQEEKTVFQVVVNRGKILFHRNGKIYRTVIGSKITDEEGNLIMDQADIARQWLLQGKFSYVAPNLDLYVSDNPFIKRLAKNICSWYDTDDNRKNGILKFVQSLKYSVMPVSGQAKTPKDSLLSAEADCEDASTFTISLFSAAGFDCGYIAMKSRKKGEPGHAVPVVVFPNGNGITYFAKHYAFAETTNSTNVGEGSDYSKFEFNFFHPHGGPPKKF